MCVANGLSLSFDLTVICMRRNEEVFLSDDQSLVEGLNERLGFENRFCHNWWGMNIFYALGLFPCYFLNWAFNVIRKRRCIFDQPGVIFAVYPVFLT